MRKFIFALPIVIFALSTGCATAPADESITNEEKPTDNKYANEYTYEDYQPPVYKLPEYTLYEKNYPPCEDPPQEDPPCECSGLSEYEREQLRVWTVEELGEIIVASGNFWNDWWKLTGYFDFKHFALFEREELHRLFDYREQFDISSPQYHAVLEQINAINIAEMWEAFNARIPEHLRNMTLEIIAPSAPFTSLDGIRNYLLQFYTVAWVDEIFSHRGFPFFEYENVLYVMTGRICAYRPNWRTATHTLIEQSGCRAVVESAMFVPPDEITEYGVWTISFTFINGRIYNDTWCCMLG